MADFNAGSIEGTLDLDTSPFVNGLRLAKAQASEFEGKDYTATLKTNYETTGDKPGPMDAKDTTTTAKIKADDSQFNRTLAGDEVKLRAFGRQKATAKVDVDSNKALAALRALDRNVNTIAGFYKHHGDALTPGTGHGLMWLVGLAASLAPALAPAVPAVALFGAAALAAFGGAAASLGLYAAVMKGAVTDLLEANKAGVKLTGEAGKAQTALQGLSKAWEALHKATAPGQYQLLAKVFSTLQTVIPKLVPLINAMSKGLSLAFDPIKHVLEGGQFERFVRLLSTNAVKDLPMLGQIAANGFRALMSIFTALNPVIQTMLRWTVGISHEFAVWARTQMPGFVRQMFGLVKQEGPPLLHMLGSILSGLMNIAKGFGPLIGPATTFLTGLGKALQTIDLGPLATGIGAMLTALTPFLGIIADLVNVILPPLGRILTIFANDFLVPFGTALEQLLVPAFQDFADVLDFAAPYIGKIVNSLADLFNPTGVGAFAQLIRGLKPVFEQLIPPLTNLVLAIEGMVDEFIQALIPYIPSIVKGFGDIATALIPVVNGLAWFLGHKGVAVTILGVAAAIKSLSVATGLLEGVVAVLGGPLTLIVLAVAALGVAFLVAYKHSATFRRVVQEIAQWVQGSLWPALKQFGSYLLHTVAPAVLKFAETIGRNLLPIVKALVDVWEHDLLPAFRKIHPQLNQLGAALKVVIPWLIKFWAGVLEIESAIVGKVLPVFIQFWGFLMKYWIPALVTIISAVVQWVAEMVKGAIALYKAGEATINFIKGVWDFLKDSPGKVKAFFTNASDWLKEKGEAIILGLIKGVENKWKDAKTWLHDRKETVKGFFSDAVNWLLNAGTHVISGLLQGVRNKWSDVAGWLRDRPGVFKGYFDNAVNWLDDKGRQVLAGLWSGIKGKWTDDVQPWLAGVGGKITGAVPALGDLLTQAGRDVMQGFYNGILEIWHKIQSTVGGMGKWIKDHKGPKAVDLALLRPAGQWVMTGLLRGIDDLMPALQSKMGDVTDALQISPMTPRLSIAGNAAQARALVDLRYEFEGMMADVVRTLQNEGAQSRAEDAATRSTLVDALDGHADKIITSDKQTTTAAITALRRG